MKIKLGSAKTRVWLVLGGSTAIALALSVYGPLVCCPNSRYYAKIVIVDGDFTGLKSSLRLYEEAAGAYPTQEQGLEALHTRLRGAQLPKKRWSSVLSSSERLLDPWETPYRYRFPGSVDPKTPEVISAGPDTEVWNR